MTVSREQTLLYMRMGAAKSLDPLLEVRLTAMEKEMLAAARPAFCSLEADVYEAAGGRYRVGPLELASESLRRELSGCSKAFLFCATLGTAVDARLRRLGAVSAADLLMAQAAATALLESYCDDCERTLLAGHPAAKSLRMRFAPGYGDLPLETQRPLLEALDASRRIGVCLTDSLLMVPSKSISAIIGIDGEEKT